MSLFFAVLCLALAGVIYSVVLLGGRNPKAPKWADESLVTNVYVPVAVGLILVGVCLFFNLLLTLGTSVPTLIELTASAALGAAAYFGIKRLRVKERIAAFESGRTETGPKATVIPMPKSAPESGAAKPSTEGRSAA